MVRLTTALLAGVLLSIPCSATWTLTQVKGNTCTGTTTCAVTVTSTGASHLLVAGVIDFAATATTISSVTAAACSSTWTHAASSNQFSTSGGSTDLFYCTNSASGQTSITLTLNHTTSGGEVVIWEASSTLGNIAIDSGATPAGGAARTACTSCTGTSLTLSGNNNFIAVLAGCQNSGTGLTGTGFTNDLANPGGDNVGHGITSGSVTAPATFTQNTSGAMTIDAAAFQESSGGGGGKKCTLAITGAGPC